MKLEESMRFEKNVEMYFSYLVIGRVFGSIQIIYFKTRKEYTYTYISSQNVFYENDNIKADHRMLID